MLMQEMLAYAWAYPNFKFWFVYLSGFSEYVLRVRLCEMYTGKVTEAWLKTQSDCDRK